MSVFGFEGMVALIAVFVTLVLAIFAFVNALLYSATSYQAADKLTKPAWLLILGAAVAIELFGVSGFGLLQIAAIVAPLVYLTDVRPALAGLRRR